VWFLWELQATDLFFYTYRKCLRYETDNSIRKDLKQINESMINWIDSASDRDYLRTLDNAALILWVPYPMELDCYTVP
jgi:hypothetical protein